MHSFLKELTGSNLLPRRSSTLEKTHGTPITKRQRPNCVKSLMTALLTSKSLRDTPQTFEEPSLSPSRGWTASWRNRGPKTRGLRATHRLSWHPDARRPRTLALLSTINSGQHIDGTHQYIIQRQYYQLIFKNF